MHGGAWARDYFRHRSFRALFVVQGLAGKLFYPSHCPVSRRSRFSLTAQKTEGESNQFFVALNGSLSCRSSGGDQFLFHGRGKDRGERCAASGAFNGSSPTANLVSIIKGQGSRRKSTSPSEAARRASVASFESKES